MERTPLHLFPCLQAPRYGCRSLCPRARGRWHCWLGSGHRGLSLPLLVPRCGLPQRLPPCPFPLLRRGPSVGRVPQSAASPATEPLTAAADLTAASVPSQKNSSNRQLCDKRSSAGSAGSGSASGRWRRGVARCPGLSDSPALRLRKGKASLHSASSCLNQVTHEMKEAGPLSLLRAEGRTCPLPLKCPYVIDAMLLAWGMKST